MSFYYYAAIGCKVERAVIVNLTDKVIGLAISTIRYCDGNLVRCRIADYRKISFIRELLEPPVESEAITIGIE